MNITDTNPDYNYPTLNRKDLMSLSTINNNDANIRKFKCINTKRDWSANLYNLDIEGINLHNFRNNSKNFRHISP
jgi:hypothetical protein